MITIVSTVTIRYHTPLRWAGRAATIGHLNTTVPANHCRMNLGAARAPEQMTPAIDIWYLLAPNQCGCIHDRCCVAAV